MDWKADLAMFGRVFSSVIGNREMNGVAVCIQNIRIKSYKRVEKWMIRNSGTENKGIRGRSVEKGFRDSF